MYNCYIFYKTLNTMENPYTKPITIKDINYGSVESESSKQNKIIIAVKSFVSKGVEGRKDINQNQKNSTSVKLTYNYIAATEKHQEVKYRFTVDEMLDDNAGFPVLCKLVIEKWTNYTHAKCPIKTELITTDDNVQEFPYSVVVDTESNMLFISFMLIFWDIFKDEILIKGQELK